MIRRYIETRVGLEFEASIQELILGFMTAVKRAKRNPKNKWPEKVLSFRAPIQFILHSNTCLWFLMQEYALSHRKELYKKMESAKNFDQGIAGLKKKMLSELASYSVSGEKVKIKSHFVFTEDPDGSCEYAFWIDSGEAQKAISPCPEGVREITEPDEIEEIIQKVREKSTRSSNPLVLDILEACKQNKGRVVLPYVKKDEKQEEPIEEMFLTETRKNFSPHVNKVKNGLLKASIKNCLFLSMGGSTYALHEITKTEAAKKTQ